MRNPSPSRKASDYIEAVMDTNYYKNGEWFHAQYVTQALCAKGFKTSTGRIERICGDMATPGYELLELWMQEISKTARRAMYRRRSTGKELLSKKWRKHSNESLEVSQCCLFPA